MGNMNSTLSGKAMINPTIVGCSSKSSFQDVPTLVSAYEAEPANFKPRASAPIRATKTKVAQNGVAPAGGRVLRSARVFSGGAAIPAQGVASPIATCGLSRGFIICCAYTCVIALIFVFTCTVVRAGDVLPCWVL